MMEKIYKTYKHQIYPHINHLRGSDWVKRKTATLADARLPRARESPTNVLDLEWDNLIILDACRHDFYEKIKGDSDFIVSVGSHSREFVKKTFGNRNASDVVYISGNPHISDSTFQNQFGKDLEDVFYEVYRTYEEKWSEKYRTVHPDEIVIDAKSAAKLFPDKRKIIHFMQPHAPFLGSLEENGGSMAVEDPEYVELLDIAEREGTVYDVRRKYGENLEFVLNYVEKLVLHLEGRTVITADHGELLGENGLYNHPYGMKTSYLKKVPWDVVEE